MGLDMFAYAVNLEDAIGDFDIAKDEDRVMKTEELYYWRKHHDLHGWMEALYRKKGGQGEFNCCALRLTEEDLDALESDVTRQLLPETTGFFFGNNPPNDETVSRDSEFIKKARETIAEGKAVYYDSWW